MAYFSKRITGSGDIDERIAPTGDFQVVEIRLHLQAVGGAAENFVVNIDSGKGYQWDDELDSQDMNAATDELFLPTRPHVAFSGDAIQCSWTNTNTVEWGLTVIWQGV